MSEHSSTRPAKRSRHDQAEGSGPVAMFDPDISSDGGLSSVTPSKWGASGRAAVLEAYRRHWKGAWQDTRCLQTLEGHSDCVAAVAVLDADRIVSASSDKTLKVWSLASGECLQTLSGHEECVNAVAVLDPDRIVSGSDD